MLAQNNPHYTNLVDDCRLSGQPTHHPYTQGEKQSCRQFSQICRHAGKWQKMFSFCHTITFCQGTAPARSSRNYSSEAGSLLFFFKVQLPLHFYIHHRPQEPHPLMFVRLMLLMVMHPLKMCNQQTLICKTLLQWCLRCTMLHVILNFIL